MDNNINKPERGNRPGVYEAENLEGERIELIADSYPMADAYVHMGLRYLRSIEEWRSEQIEKRAKEIEAKQAKSGDKKGK